MGNQATAAKAETKPTTLSAEEQEELRALQEAEDAQKRALEAGQRQQSAAAAAASTDARRPPAPKPVEKRYPGDIPVTCLKTEAFCQMGGPSGRKYNLKKGAEVLMDPSHAQELSQGPDPWVAPVTVVHRS